MPSPWLMRSTSQILSLDACEMFILFVVYLCSVRRIEQEYWCLRISNEILILLYGRQFLRCWPMFLFGVVRNVGHED